MSSSLSSPLSRPSRRHFIAGAGAAAAASGFATGVLPGGTELAFAEPNDSAKSDVIVQVFLDGGADGLSLVPPVFDTGLNADYRALRVDGTFDIAVDPATALDLGGHPIFGLHPAFAPLYPAWTDANMAIIHAAGSPSSLTSTRSHFDAQEVWKRCGLPNATPAGWLARHLNTSADADGSLPGVAASSQLLVSMRGSPSAVAVSSIGGFNVFGFSDTAAVTSSLVDLYAADSGLFGSIGTRALNAVNVVSTVDTTTPPMNGAAYPNTGLGRDLQEVAQMIRADIGLQAVAVNTGGWDTHDDMGPASAGSRMYDRISYLTESLGAFYTDLGADMAEVTIVVLSEFGRTINVNGNGGTDHGRGSAMFVIGGGINGGVYGAFPSVIEDGPEGDLAVMNDFRQVLAEVITGRLDNGANLSSILPGFTPAGTPFGIT
ncbi:MAG: DUF1501 domain-containing protein [Acidimicrobiia bacterium]|nr:DUF1501 domain-containing protein [Acidimicrobiia bacterium]